MLKDNCVYSAHCGPFQGDDSREPHKVIETSTGALFIHDYCSPALVEQLRADSGLRAFARLPEREHTLLLDIAEKPESKLTLAYTPAGDIVGQVTLAPAGSWWGDDPAIYEIAVEVSSRWRRRAIAHQLLSCALEPETIEHFIVLGMGFWWHWDMLGADLPVFRYRDMIAHLFATHKFVEYPTTEPNICSEAANILVVRLGSQVSEEIANQFFSRVFRSDNLSEFL